MFYLLYTIGNLIVNMIFLIGLDNINSIKYSVRMKKFSFSAKVLLTKKTTEKTERKELGSFAVNQFKILTEKRLKLPITLFHL